MPREKEVDSIARCDFPSAFLSTAATAESTEEDKGWTVVSKQDHDQDNAGSTDESGVTEVVPCVYSPEDTSIRLSPMFRKTPRTGPRWKPSVHFHPQLMVVTGENEGEAVKEETVQETKPKDEESTEVTAQSEVVVKVEESENKAVASGAPTTPTTESTDKVNGGRGALVLTFEAIAREGIAVALSPEPKYTGGSTYEIFYGDRGNTQTLLERRQKIGRDKIHVALPGRHCTEKQWTPYWIALNEGKVYAGIGSRPPNQCLGVLDDFAKQVQPEIDATRWFVGIGNSSMTRHGERPFLNQYRNICLAPLPSWLKTKLGEIDNTKMSIINVQEDEMDAETKELFKEYEEECQKAKARADKFGIPYKEPPSFLPWSKIRRLQANPKEGFATGFDLQDPEEKAKQEARRKRFGLETAEDATLAMDTEVDALPVTQAWEHEQLVRGQRVDPPPSLWKVVPSAGDMPVDHGNAFASRPVESVIVPEKIHLFAIDWAAFKQIRTNDISAYFGMYSPTYVEWINDFSCNIHFQDKFSAGRALENLAQEIPSPPPQELQQGEEEEKQLPDLGAMGWRFGKTLLRKTADDRFGRRGTTARLLLRLATSHDVLSEKPSTKSKNPPGFTKNRILGPGSKSKEGRRGKGKRSRDIRKGEGQQIQELGEAGEPLLLGGSLKASRSGFSVEEMEAERARKRAKKTGGEDA